MSEYIHTRNFTKIVNSRCSKNTPPLAAGMLYLRKRLGLKLPDAIIAATALSLSATLLTNDQRLLALTEIPTQGLQVLSV